MICIMILFCLAIPSIMIEWLHIAVLFSVVESQENLFDFPICIMKRNSVIYVVHSVFRLAVYISKLILNLETAAKPAKHAEGHILIML
jgi:hypothetical protein